MIDLETGNKLSVCMFVALIVSWISLFSLVNATESQKEQVTHEIKEERIERKIPVYSLKVGSAYIIDVNVDNLPKAEDITQIEEPEVPMSIHMEESKINKGELELEVINETEVIEEEPQKAEPEPAINSTPLVSNRWGLVLSDYEKQLVANITWLEAGNQSDDGQQAVIAVVLNRVASSQFPNTVEGVLSQKNPVQFTTWSKLSSATPTEQVYNNVDAVLNGAGNTNVINSDWLYFNGTGPSRATVIGDHKFWR